MYHQILDYLITNPLVKSIFGVLARIDSYKKDAKEFYFDVLLSIYSCPKCNGKLQMFDVSLCRCGCGVEFDPTIAFQKSNCCGVPLSKKTFHYVCSKCGKVAPSRFLFDERIFDPEYFKEKMRESRENKRKKREEIRMLLEGSRSDIFNMENIPDIVLIPELLSDLDGFIQESSETERINLNPEDIFNMESYRQKILSFIQDQNIRFNTFPQINDNYRKDRARRFTTLIFMEQEREVCLTQYNDDILVEKYEAYSEG